VKVLLSWLNELAPVGSDVDALADQLSMLGLAVDGIEHVGAAVDGVVVARVLGLRPHPQADRIQLVDVDRGDGEALQVCCGAFNMAVGDLVPLATLGTVMPNGMEIARRKLRGEWSNGMLCSSRELHLGDDHAGILVLPDGLELGAPVFEALGVSADVVFDLDLTRNRPDAWCHLGVARDLAAHRGVGLMVPSPSATPAGAPRTVGVEIVDGDLCGRFTSTVLTGVVVGPSPRWMAERLVRTGMRPINNVVDVSNYVMLELGQPNHPYDAATLGGGAFRVRRARPGEVLVTLDGTERRLAGDDLLICDGHDMPVGLAGIMGGAHTEIGPDTTTVALEMAWFRPEAVASTAGRLGLRTEASARFERGVDPAVADLAIARFVELLRETCPDVQVAPGAVDARGDLPAAPTVGLRTSRINALLGTGLTDDEVAGLLAPIGFTVTAVAPGRADVTVPSWRLDCEVEIDLVEEVARHYGYERLGKTVPTSAHPGALSEHQRDRRLVREVLVGAGLAEAMPNPLLGPGDHERAGLSVDAIALHNPMAAEESLLRASLRPGLLKALGYNASHRRSGIGLFEVGHVYRLPVPATAPLPDEREVVAVAWAGRDALAAVAVWDEVVAALGIEGVQVVAAEPSGLHPTRSAELVAPSGTVIGLVGEIDPDVAADHGIAERVAWLEVDLVDLLALPHGERRYRRVSRYPSSDVDLAFAVPDRVSAAAVTGAVRAAAGDLLADLALFDVYRGPGVADGTRSLAYRLRLQAADRTLSDTDVAGVRRACIDAAAAAGAVLRGA
jgi:phenylalanyl-tRNA synthetase beta chain